MSNILAKLSTSVVVEVVQAVPDSLQINIIHPTRRPSCNPTPLTSNDHKVETVFSREMVTLEASVDVGYNLTFTWVIDTPVGTPHIDQIEPLPDCIGRNCTTTLKVRQYYKCSLKLKCDETCDERPPKMPPKTVFQKKECGGRKRTLNHV